MNKPLRVLIVDDSEDDTLILINELEQNHYDPYYLRVDTYQGFTQALKSQQWDIVISDYIVPHFSGLAVLEIAKASNLELPVIILSGAISEEIAVKTMKAGAHDYVMKDNLTRLAPVIERELKEADVRRARLSAEERIHHLTYHDPLTGILNRREFERRVSQAIETANLLNRHHALFFLDLDQFKIINDTCGHVAGDELLRQITQLMEKHLRETDTVARLGGDEFGILIDSCPNTEARRTADNIRRLIKNFRFIWQNEAYDITVSIGVVFIDESVNNIDRLLSNADIACYGAKDQGRDCVFIFEPGDKTANQLHGEMRWATRISKAISENRFSLFCQSILPINGEKTEHFEILLRMIDENGNLVYPGEFVPAAERYNLMATIDRWVIDKVVSMLVEQEFEQKTDTNPSLYTINLSGASINNTAFLDYVKNKLKNSKNAVNTLCFEITETAAIENVRNANRFIEELKSIGCQFALDDFGTGLSSFSYLKNFPVDFLKIDGSFVRDIDKDPISCAMVESIVSAKQTTPF
ncbi:MAG: EAL domain-containing protein [Gammaproteobacteria bacterium]